MVHHHHHHHFTFLMYAEANLFNVKKCTNSEKKYLNIIKIVNICYNDRLYYVCHNWIK